MVQVWEFVQEVWNTLRSGGFPDLGIWSYVLLTLLVATEGPLSTLLAAAAAAAGYLRIDWVFFAAITGNILGDCLWYSLGYAGHPERVHRFGRWLGIHSKHISRLERAMHRHAAKLIILSKLSFGFIIPTLIAAGIARVPLRRWLPVVLVVETLWTILLTSVGYHATSTIARFERSLQIIGVAILLLLLATVVWYVRRLIRKEEEEKALRPPLKITASPLPRPPKAIQPRDPHTRFSLEQETPPVVTSSKPL